MAVSVRIFQVPGLVDAQNQHAYMCLSRKHHCYTARETKLSAGQQWLQGTRLQYSADVDTEAAHAVDVPTLEVRATDENLELLTREAEAPPYELVERVCGHADLCRVEAVLHSRCQYLTGHPSQHLQHIQVMLDGVAWPPHATALVMAPQSISHLSARHLPMYSISSVATHRPP